MNTFFNKVKKLSQNQSKEIAALSGAMALLILIAGFIAGGGRAHIGQSIALKGISSGSQTASIFPCSWFGDCPSGPGPTITEYYSFSASQTTVTAGQSVTLTYYAGNTTNGAYAYSYCQGAAGGVSGGKGGVSGRDRCFITPGVGEVGYPGSGLYGQAVVVPPQGTTTYTFCSWHMNDNGSPCLYVAVTAISATMPTALTSFTATPSLVQSGSPASLAWTGTKGTNFSACQLTGGQWGSGTWFTALPGSTPTNPLTQTTIYSMNCYDTNGANTGWKSATVSVRLGSCDDIPSAAVVPNGCVVPVPSPGVCIPAGGSYSPGSNTCSCPAGQHVEGATCVKDPLCSNGLNDSYAPSCTCPAHQYQPLGVSSCIALPVCSNGLSEAYSPSCSCPSGQVQKRGGSSCVPQGSINSFTANPSRVLAGRPATVTWSTSHMDECSVSSFTSAGTTILSTVLSATLTPSINSKTVLTLTCSDASGASYSSSVTVSMIPQTIEQ